MQEGRKAEGQKERLTNREIERKTDRKSQER